MVENTKRTITNVRQLPRLLHAIYNGTPIRLLATGDVEGMSPAYFCNQGIGQPRIWIKFEDPNLEVSDPDALPYSTETFNQMKNAGRGTGASPR